MSRALVSRARLRSTLGLAAPKRFKSATPAAAAAASAPSSPLEELYHTNPGTGEALDHMSLREHVVVHPTGTGVAASGRAGGDF